MSGQVADSAMSGWGRQLAVGESHQGALRCRRQVDFHSSASGKLLKGMTWLDSPVPRSLVT